MIDIILAAAAEPAASHSLSIPIWTIIRNGLSVICLLAGLFFVLGGTLGVLRLPDFFTRLHAAGMTDTLGAEMILTGLIIQAGFSQMSLKLLLVGFFLFITSPTATHAIANAAYQAGLKPMLGKYKAPSPADIGSDAGEDH